MTLHELRREQGTGKVSSAQDHLKMYEAFVAPFKHSAQIVMEIGVRDGSSLRIWRDYFTHAQIVGVDILDECRSHEDAGIAIEIGDQGDGRFLRDLVNRYKPDIAVDNGSHKWRHQINSFRVVFPQLNPGGLYICEALQTSKANALGKYGSAYTLPAAAYFGQLAAQVGAEGQIYGAMADQELSEIREQIDWIRFQRRFVAIKKKN